MSRRCTIGKYRSNRALFLRHARQFRRLGDKEALKTFQRLLAWARYDRKLAANPPPHPPPTEPVWLPVQFLGGAFDGVRAKHIENDTYVTHLGFLGPFKGKWRVAREYGQLLCRPEVPQDRLTDFDTDTGVPGPVDCPRCLDMARRQGLMEGA